MIAFQDYFNESPQPNNNCVRDPLHQSEDATFPFPHEAAKTLADLRSNRFDHCDLTIEEAEMRIREFASMMGLSTLHDDPPSAA